jgi:hypothetical protein
MLREASIKTAIQGEATRRLAHWGSHANQAKAAKLNMRHNASRPATARVVRRAVDL